MSLAPISQQNRFCSRRHRTTKHEHPRNDTNIPGHDASRYSQPRGHAEPRSARFPNEAGRGVSVELTHVICCRRHPPAARAPDGVVRCQNRPRRIAARSSTRERPSHRERARIVRRTASSSAYGTIRQASGKRGGTDRRRGACTRSENEGTRFGRRMCCNARESRGVISSALIALLTNLRAPGGLLRREAGFFGHQSGSDLLALKLDNPFRPQACRNTPWMAEWIGLAFARRRSRHLF